VTLRLDNQYNQIPDDSYAVIQTQGLLGGKYVGFSPGGSDTNLKDGSRVDQTQSAIVLESLINKLFASFADKGNGGGQGNGNGNSPSPDNSNSQQGTKK
jgi:phospholipid/cholesterol/gamma-HCH transport system substrate-binding protein